MCWVSNLRFGSGTILEDIPTHLQKSYQHNRAMMIVKPLKSYKHNVPKYEEVVHLIDTAANIDLIEFELSRMVCCM